MLLAQEGLGHPLLCEGDKAEMFPGCGYENILNISKLFKMHSEVLHSEVLRVVGHIHLPFRPIPLLAVGYLQVSLKESSMKQFLVRTHLILST